LWSRENNAIILGSVKGDDELPDVPGEIELTVLSFTYIHTYMHACMHTYIQYIHLFAYAYCSIITFSCFIWGSLCALHNSLGGLGSCGAPNDGGIHQNFHLLRQAYQRTALGWLRNPAFAKGQADYEVNNQGEIKFPLALPVSLESDAYALQCLRAYENGKIVHWAWSSRGYSTLDDIARWLFHGSTVLAEEFMAPSKKNHLIDQFGKLEKPPALTILGEDDGRDLPSNPSNLLIGEKVHIWFVDCGIDGMMPLPHWCSLHIECGISVWKNELRSWQQKIRAKAPKPLPPAQKKQFDLWVENSTRRIVLDQQTKMQIKNPAACSKSRLVKHGILLDSRPQTPFVELFYN